MKNLLIFFIVATLFSCSGEGVKNPSLTDGLYVCGKVNIPYTTTQLGIIHVTSNHDHSSKVLYNENSGEKAKELKYLDEICFQVNSLKGVPFAEKITSKDSLKNEQFYTKDFRTKLSVHRELDHDFSKNVHKKTHISMEGYNQNTPNIFYAFKDEEDIFNDNVDIANMDKIVVNPGATARILKDDNRVYYANWADYITIRNENLIPVGNLKKCHSHGATDKVCIKK